MNNYFFKSEWTMSTVSKKLLFFFILYCSVASAQKTQPVKAKIDTSSKNQLIKKSKWEGGLLLGGTGYSGDLEFALPESRPLVGLFIRRAMGNYFALNASLTQGLLAGSDAHSTQTPWRVSRNIQFKSSLTELSLRGEIHFFGNMRKVKDVGSVMSDTVSKSFKWRVRRISPFLYVGGGMVLLNPKTNFNDYPKPNPITEAPRIAADKAVIFDKILPIVPLGGGFRIPLLDKQATLTIEGGFRPTFSDYVDGVSIAGNPNIYDWYFVGDVAFSKLFGNKKDSDGDGIADKNDLCPYLKGDPKLKGCPDRDGDGIPDNKDGCPTVAGLAVYEGCPDTDKDGIIDKYDECPTVAGLGQYKGCPTEKPKEDSSTSIVSLPTDSLKTVADMGKKTTQSADNSKPIAPNDTLSVGDNAVKKTTIPPQYNAEKTPKTTEETPKEVTVIEPEPINPKIEKPVVVEQVKTPQTVVTQPITPTTEGSKPENPSAPTTVLPSEKPVVVGQVETPQTVVTQPITPTTEGSKPENPSAPTTASPSEKTVIVRQVEPLSIAETQPTTPTTEGGKTETSTVPTAVLTTEKSITVPQKETPKPNAARPINPMEPAVLLVKDKLVIATEEGTPQPATPTTESPKPIAIMDINVETNTVSAPNSTTPYTSADNTKASAIVRNYAISPVYFDSKKAIYKPESFVILDEVAFILMKNRRATLLIKGHTDSTGTLALNQALSINRAKACQTYLVKKGIAPSRITFKGFGALQPVAGNESVEERQLNRRVEFVITHE